MTPWRTQPCPVLRLPPPQLQCGHGSDAVENRLEAAVKDALDKRLQCGHGSDAVENFTLLAKESDHGEGFNAATAVTPWRTRRRGRSSSRAYSFNAATAVTPWRTGGAGLSGSGQTPLQCGHGSDAVENKAMCLGVTGAGAPLQCGHGSDAVENRARGGGAAGAVGASMRPRQ